MRVQYHYYDQNDFDQAMNRLSSRQLMVMTEVKVERSGRSDGVGLLEIKFEPVNLPAVPAVPLVPKELPLNEVFWRNVRLALSSTDGVLRASVMNMLLEQNWIQRP